MRLARGFSPAAGTLILCLCTARALSGQAPAPSNRITIDPAKQFQVIEGFGLNYTGPYFRNDQKPMFDMLVKDLGASMFRVVAYFVYSDWESTNDNDDPHSANWEYYNSRYSNPVFEATWNGLRHLNSMGIRPVLALMGPVPDWMVEEGTPPPQHKVCQSSSKLGRLKPEMYDEFAETVVTMAAYARRKAGVDFDLFSPFNETDCYPPEGPRVDPDEVAKVLTAVARRMNQEGLGDVRLAVADHAIITTDYISPVLKDADLMKQVGAFTVHTYGEDSVGPHVKNVARSAFRNVPVWLTEYGDLNDQDQTFENEWKRYSLGANRRALTALNQGAGALFYFNAFDDYEECARRLTYYGLFRSAGQVYSPKKRYYATKQLYHFVKPGARRIAVTTDAQGVTISAFQDGESDSLVVVGVKQGGPNRLKITLPAPSRAPRSWDLYMTTHLLDCRKVQTIQNAGPSLEIELPDEAVFTLTGRF
ncbi:MAG TPA: hypothetical protein VLE22_20505 [Bryobacteraceae bacterium]|nr:hypothetical protein [Bryobacteraceae bacterium]